MTIWSLPPPVFNDIARQPHSGEGRPAGVGNADRVSGSFASIQPHIKVREDLSCHATWGAKKVHPQARLGSDNRNTLRKAYELSRPFQKAA